MSAERLLDELDELRKAALVLLGVEVEAVPRSGEHLEAVVDPAASSAAWKRWMSPTVVNVSSAPVSVGIGGHPGRTCRIGEASATLLTEVGADLRHALGGGVGHR